MPDIEAERAKHDIVSFDLEPGDCTVHHGLLVHHAPGNSSTERRRHAYVTRWTGDDARFYPHDGIQHMPPLPDIAAVYVAQIEDERVSEAMHSGEYLNATEEVLERHGEQWFRDESFIVSRRGS